MLLETVRRAAEFARDMKSSWVRHNHGETDDFDLRPFVQAYRGGELIAWVCVTDDEAMMSVARGAAGGFDADILVVIADAWCTRYETDLPEPASADAHEAFRAAVAAGEPDRGEGLFISALNRAGDIVALGMPYKVVDGDVQWQEEHLYPAEEAVEVSGTVAETLRTIMDEPTISQRMNSLGISHAHFELAEEEMRAMQDAIAATQISKTVPNCMLWLNCPQGTKRAETLARHLPPGVIGPN